MARNSQSLSDDELDELLEKKEDLEETLSDLNYKLKDSQKSLKDSKAKVKKAFGTTVTSVLKKKKLTLGKRVKQNMEALEENELYQEMCS